MKLLIREADYQRVVDKFWTLVDEPRPQDCERLYNDIYRVRVGDIRIIYLVDEENKRIEVGAIRRRERTYKGVDELFR